MKWLKCKIKLKMIEENIEFTKTNSEWGSYFRI